VSARRRRRAAAIARLASPLEKSARAGGVGTAVKAKRPFTVGTSRRPSPALSPASGPSPPDSSVANDVRAKLDLIFHCPVFSLKP